MISSIWCPHTLQTLGSPSAMYSFLDVIDSRMGHGDGLQEVPNLFLGSGLCCVMEVFILHMIP